MILRSKDMWLTLFLIARDRRKEEKGKKKEEELKLRRIKEEE